jgi:putative nucleotidyltransferase with HDIG domain
MFAEARMGRTVDTGGARRLVEEISDSVSRSAGALISLARLKTADDYTYMHSVAVCALMVALARQLGLGKEEVRSAGIAGLLHDLGKAADTDRHPQQAWQAHRCRVRDRQDASGERLQDASREQRRRPRSRWMSSSTTTKRPMARATPSACEGREISLFAKMAAVCDVYDAITSNRPYKAGWDPAESLRRMAEWSNGHFDPTVFQAFVKSIGIYPIGSLVLLNCGRIGVVIEQNEKSLLHPQVKVFFSTRRARPAFSRKSSISPAPAAGRRSSAVKTRPNGTFLTSTKSGADLAVVAHQRPGAPLRMVKLAAWKAIVDQQ